MHSITRRGDANSAGGVTTGGSSKVFADGKPVVWPGVSVTPHPCCGQPGCGIHCSAVTTGGSSKVFADGKPIIRVGADSDNCGHTRATGSQKVFLV